MTVTIPYQLDQPAAKSDARLTSKEVTRTQITMTKTKTHKTNNEPLPVPICATYEEEATVWDTHDITDYAFRPVKVTVAKNLSSIVTVRFEGETLTKLERQAEQKGLGTATMIRMWVMKRLNGQAMSAAHNK